MERRRRRAVFLLDRGIIFSVTNKISLPTIFALLTLLGALILLTMVIKTRTPLKDSLEVKDEPAGLVFSVPKSFQAISSDRLKAKNPFFLYGYNPADVKEVECFVSQTKNPKEGVVSADYLREGLLNQLKKAYEGVEQERWDDIKLGAVAGTKMTVKYKVDDATYKLTEIVGSTAKKTTFAACSAPNSLFSVYTDQFNVLFNSLRLAEVN